MRIVLVEFPPSGGLYQFAAQLGQALAAQGHQVVILTGPDPEIVPDQPGLRVVPILPTWHPSAGADSATWVRKGRRVVRAGQHAAAWGVALRWLRRHRPDVVAWSSWRFALDGAGVLVARRVLPQATLALVAHEPVPLVEQPGADALEKDTGGPNSVMGRAYQALDVAFVLGDSAREVLQRVWQPTAPVVVIPHGTEDVFLDHRPVHPGDQTPPRVLFFGTITGYKGLDDLLQAWPEVRRQIPEATLTVAGNVSADVDQVALADTVARLEGVHLETGYVPTAAVHDLFDGARVVALPYRRSSQSGVAHLAQTFSRPVVTTAVGDIPTVVQDGVTGWVVPPADQQALIAALVHALQDAPEAGRRGAAGRAHLEQESSWTTVADRFVEGLQQATARRGRPA